MGLFADLRTQIHVRRIVFFALCAILCTTLTIKLQIEMLSDAHACTLAFPSLDSCWHWVHILRVFL